MHTELTLNQNFHKVFWQEVSKNTPEMAEALITFFLENLAEQLVQEGKLLSGVQQDIEWIKSELQAMVAFIKAADRRQQRRNDDESIRNWVGEVRYLLYDAEDIIDEFVIQMGTIRWNNIIKQYQVRRRTSLRTSCQIKKIKSKVVEVKERRDRYGFHLKDDDDAATSIVRGSSRGGPGAASPFVQEDGIVGIEEDVEQVRKLLLDGKMGCGRLVISVFGMGGLGKTTLVKEVYKKCKTRFDCYSWVFVSQFCSLRDLLRNILFGFKASRGEPAMEVMDAMDEGQLQERTYHYLQDKKYLLVLDDIWDAKVWEELKHALPRETGRIILTTRIRGIASPSNCHVYDLQPLSDELAWSVFCRKAFPGKGTCPEDLQELAEAIVRRCSGLPLAIVAIGGLVSSRNDNIPISQSILHTHGELSHNHDLDRLNTALLFSYNHLPFYLKYCFLYTGLFPEDYEIGRKRLIRMWVAEGFVRKTSSKTEEEVANHYFTQLIDRSMIQAVMLHARDVVKACRVHDLMRDVATDMLQQEKFGVVLTDGDSSIEERQRRLSIYDSVENVPSNMGKMNLHSFLMFRITELSPSAFRKLLLELMLARVLNLQGVPIEILPDEVGNLIHLRYLDLRGTQIERLPKSLKNLRNLQTLDVRNTNLRSLPPGINMLQQLRHLHMASFRDRDKGLLKMPKGRKCFKNIQTLSGVECDDELVKELRDLTNLRKLYIGGVTGANSKELFASIAEMKNLRSLTIISDDSSLEQHQIESLSRAPLYMEKLKLQVSMRRLPKWFDSLKCLHTLYLFKNFLQEDPFPILERLPNLVILTLASSAFACEAICCSKQGFPKLKLLRILDIANWKTWKPIEESTMLSLQYLLIADCPKLMQLPEGFHHLTALQDLTLKGMSTHFSYNLKGAGRWKVSHVEEVSILTQVGGEFVRRKLE